MARRLVFLSVLLTLMAPPRMASAQQITDDSVFAISFDDGATYRLSNGTVFNAASNGTASLWGPSCTIGSGLTILWWVPGEPVNEYRRVVVAACSIAKLVELVYSYYPGGPWWLGGHISF